jgi:hypothetical protein
VCWAYLLGGLILRPGLLAHRCSVTIKQQLMKADLADITTINKFL